MMLTLLSLTNKANNKRLTIDEEKFSHCGLCAKNCSNNIITITKEEQKISRNECLYCLNVKMYINLKLFLIKR